MKDLATVSMSACMAVLVATSAYAKNDVKLPKGAEPLSEAEATAVYAGKTIKWTRASMYFSPEGKTVGTSTSGYYGEGTWKASGNEVCYDSVWYGKQKSDTEKDHICEKFYKVGKVLWIENTANDKQEEMGKFWTGLEKKLKKGDLASKEANAFKAKYGY